jgi:AhpD family alkylhydroperoxidase
MPHIPILKAAEASKEAQIVYEEFHRRMSFPEAPNFILTQGHSPSVARGTWELVRNVLVLGEIPRWTKEMIFVAISSDRSCRYCAAAHIACCRMLGVNPETLEQLVKNVNGLADLKLRQMILFALKCSRNPQGLRG